MACVRECPVGAMSADKSVKVTLAGNEVEWNDIDCEKCDMCFSGGQPTTESVSPEKQYREPRRGLNFKPGWWSPFAKKPKNLYNTGQAVCGARGCTRACINHLEKRGVLTNKFKEPFRPAGYRPWRVNWDEPTDNSAKDQGLGND
jgi:ferredoxin